MPKGLRVKSPTVPKGRLFQKAYCQTGEYILTFPPPLRGGGKKSKIWKQGREIKRKKRKRIGEKKKKGKGRGKKEKKGKKRKKRKKKEKEEREKKLVVSLVKN